MGIKKKIFEVVFRFHIENNRNFTKFVFVLFLNISRHIVCTYFLMIKIEETLCLKLTIENNHYIEVCLLI